MSPMTRDLRARSTISTTRHRLFFDSGRVSVIRTVSPVFAEFSSSCAFTRFVRVTILPYTGCGTQHSIATTTVFCILSLTTRPVRVFRVPRSVAFCSNVSAIGLFRLLAQHRLESRNVTTDHAQTQRILERLGRTAEPQPKLLLFQLPDAAGDVAFRHLTDLISSHWCAPPRASRTSCAPASWLPRGPSPSWRCQASRLRVRTSRGPASRPPPTSPANPYPYP